MGVGNRGSGGSCAVNVEDLGKSESECERPTLLVATEPVEVDRWDAMSESRIGVADSLYTSGGFGLIRINMSSRRVGRIDGFQNHFGCSFEMR
jgi:hypothetical protein